MTRYDVVVIGGGAAGLSAALVLSRARRQVLVVDSGQPRNASASHLHGYLSRDGLPPGELLAAGRNEVRGYGGDIVAGTRLRDRWARDVLHCPYCHGREVRDLQLGVIGGTPGAVHNTGRTSTPGVRAAGSIVDRAPKSSPRLVPAPRPPSTSSMTT